MEERTFPDQDPRPDEDAWEAYLNFVRPLLGASDEMGLENSEFAMLEQELDATVPFEIGLLLIMGVPDTFPWRNWKDDAVAQLEEWTRQVGESLELSEQDLAGAPQLFPIYANVAIPLLPRGESPALHARPLFRIDPNKVSRAGLDLADWLHREFDMPLPWWPENQDQDVPFWTARLDCRDGTTLPVDGQ